MVVLAFGIVIEAIASAAVFFLGGWAYVATGEAEALRQLAAGAFHALALSTHGEVFSFGHDAGPDASNGNLLGVGPPVGHGPQHSGEPGSVGPAGGRTRQKWPLQS